MRNAVVSALLASALLASACGDAATPAPPAGGLKAIADELCLAASDAQSERATERFLTVHGPLHDLAEQTAETDRAVAARLLRAKQQVEAAIDSEPPSEDLPVVFDELARAGVESLQTLGLQTPTNCDPFSGDAG